MPSAQEVLDIAPSFTPLVPVKTPASSPAVRVRVNTPFGHLHTTITVDLKTDRETEIFAQLGKSGSLVASELEGICRVSSLYLRVGGPLKDIVKQLLGIGSSVCFTDKEGKDPTSVPDSLGKALKHYLSAKQKYGLKALVLGEAKFDE